MDSILEDIRLHMEVNNSKFNQRRIAVVRYLSELYNYRLVDSSVIFKVRAGTRRLKSGGKWYEFCFCSFPQVLYSLISFGAATKVDDPAAVFLDPPDHMLRIRLICVVLDTCGVYFNTGGSKKKLDYFLVYFQVLETEVFFRLPIMVVLPFY